MNGRPITEDDLHAYTDHVLDSTRQAEVMAYLDAHPDVAQRVAKFSSQREMLRAALAPIADEPIPPQLNLSRIIAARSESVIYFDAHDEADYGVAVQAMDQDRKSVV